jgi:hypothetical protein
MKVIQLAIGALSIGRGLSHLVIESGIVYGNQLNIVSRWDVVLKNTVSLDLKLINDDGFPSAVFNITTTEFKTLATLLTPNQIDDRLNILGDQEKGTSDATDQVTTEAILLNDMTTTTG